jgi:hypothetical protein
MTKARQKSVWWNGGKYCQSFYFSKSKSYSDIEVFLIFAKEIILYMKMVFDSLFLRWGRIVRHDLSLVLAGS